VRVKIPSGTSVFLQCLTVVSITGVSNSYCTVPEWYACCLYACASRSVRPWSKSKHIQSVLEN